MNNKQYNPRGSWHSSDLDVFVSGIDELRDYASPVTQQYVRKCDVAVETEINLCTCRSR